MGYSADKLAEVWNVSREEQDEFALRSHKSASSALKNNLLTDVINTSTEKSLILEDNIIKHNTNTDKLIKLKPAFRKDIGTITAGNASSLTDGASACLLAIAAVLFAVLTACFINFE